MPYNPKYPRFFESGIRIAGVDFGTEGYRFDPCWAYYFADKDLRMSLCTAKKLRHC